MRPETIAIAQPAFLSWSGWFDLADQVDLLIVLDDVAFSKQSWQQRNRIRTPSGLTYLTLPVRSAGRLGQRILDTELADTAFVGKFLRTVAQNYARAAHFATHFPKFSAVLEQSAASGRLVDLNCAIIDWLADELDVRTRRVRSSELHISGRRGEYVAKLCEHVGASRYISPVGAEGYLLEDRAEFDKRSITVELHAYEHPTYRQCFQPFIPYASALDLLLNEGPDAAAIMRSGRRAARRLGVHPPEPAHRV